MKASTHLSQALRPLLLATCLAPLLTSPASAQEKTDNKREEYMKLGMKLQEVGQQLQQIQERVLEKNDPLKKKQNKLRDMVSSEMKKSGVNPDKLLAEATKLREQAQKEGLSDEKRQEITRSMMQKLETLQQAQMEALQKPQVKKVRDSFQKEMEAAMVKADPKAKKLLSEFDSLQQQMNRLTAGS